MPADLQGCRRLIGEAWRAGYRGIFSASEIEGVLSGSLATAECWARVRTGLLGTLLVELDGDIVGLATMCRLVGADGELALLYVHPEFQRQGVGSALFDAARLALRDRGCVRLRVWTLGRGDGRRFYEARGCVAVGRAEYGVGERREPVIEYAIDLVYRRATAGR